MLKVPLSFVTALVFVPFTVTVTPDNGVPCSLVTLPVTDCCCANACAATKKRLVSTRSSLFFIRRVPVGEMDVRVLEDNDCFSPPAPMKRGTVCYLDAT